MSATKRRKLYEDSLHHSDTSAIDQASNDEHSKLEDFSGSSTSPDTEDEIAAASRKSLKTSKRKRRATEPAKFGATLQSLLNTDAPSTQPLALKPSLAKRQHDEKLESKAKKVLLQERKEKEEKGRIIDVIGGWGGENERALRKVAQRGVVKLFNLIQQSQSSATASAQESRNIRGTGKPYLPAPSVENARGRKGKDNIIGRGKDSVVGQDDFFDMIRSGGIVSKV